MSDPNDNPARSRPRRKRRNYALLILAAGIFLFGVAAGTLYYVLRPTTLRIAVGPAGSEDQKLVQLMAQTFAREGSAGAAVADHDRGREREHRAVRGRQGRSCGRARRPEPACRMPSRSRSCARMSSCCGRPPAFAPKGSKKQPTPKIKSLDELAGHRVGVIGRTQANVTLLRVILKKSGINPDKVTISQFATNQIGEMARDPSRRRVHGGRPAQEQDHRGRDRGDRDGPRRAEISADRRRRRDRQEDTRSTNPRKSPAASSALRRRGPKTRSIRSASTI